MSDAASADNASPGDWRSYLEELRQQGLLNDDHEQALERFFGQRENQLAHQMQAISADYERRVQEDGKDTATEWLTSQARAMGQNDREEIERLLSSIGLPLPERGVPTTPATPQPNALQQQEGSVPALSEGPDPVTLEFHTPEAEQDKDAHLRRPRQRPTRR